MIEGKQRKADAGDAARIFVDTARRVVGAREKLLDSSCSGFRSATVMLRLGDDTDATRGSVVAELRLTTDKLHAACTRVTLRLCVSPRPRPRPPEDVLNSVSLRHWS